MQKSDQFDSPLFHSSFLSVFCWFLMIFSVFLSFSEAIIKGKSCFSNFCKKRIVGSAREILQNLMDFIKKLQKIEKWAYCWCILTVEKHLMYNLYRKNTNQNASCKGISSKPTRTKINFTSNTSTLSDK